MPEWFSWFVWIVVIPGFLFCKYGSLYYSGSRVSFYCWYRWLLKGAKQVEVPKIISYILTVGRPREFKPRVLQIVFQNSVQKHAHGKGQEPAQAFMFLLFKWSLDYLKCYLLSKAFIWFVTSCCPFSTRLLFTHFLVLIAAS
jgi:hypothetical protein